MPVTDQRTASQGRRAGVSRRSRILVMIAVLVIGLAVPSVASATPYTPTEKWIVAVHRDFLGRDPSSSELTWWNAVLGGGSSRQAVTTMIMQSTEFKTRILTAYNELYYTDIPPGTPGGDAILSTLNTSNDFLASEVAYLASASYFQNSNSDNGAFVEAIYLHLMNREADPSGYSYWTTQLNSGTWTRGQMATNLIKSNQTTTIRVRGTPGMVDCTATEVTEPEAFVSGSYCLILDRMADTAGANYWISQLTSTGQVTTLWANLAGSSEYYNHAQVKVS